LPVLALAMFAAWRWLPTPTSATAESAGIVRTSEIRIAPEIGGRLANYLVEPGQAVQRGQPVAVLVNPELWAAVGAARAQLSKAQSDRDRVYAGIRQEQVQALQQEVEKARALHENAVQELARKLSLAAHGNASVQDLDVARAAEARDLAGIAASEARYAEAQRGPTDEERALADATVDASQAALGVVEARAAKMLLRAPRSGTVAIMAAEIGEVVVPGEPVLTMIPEDGLWFGFNLREDELRGVAIGAPVLVGFSSDRQPVRCKVVELRNWGEFAVWRAARATGDHDLNTFFVRLDPVGPMPHVSPGETAWLKRLASEDGQDRGS
jgi:HlyD family secretion protein